MWPRIYQAGAWWSASLAAESTARGRPHPPSIRRTAPRALRRRSVPADGVGPTPRRTIVTAQESRDPGRPGTVGRRAMHHAAARRHAPVAWRYGRPRWVLSSSAVNDLLLGLLAGVPVALAGTIGQLRGRRRSSRGRHVGRRVSHAQHGSGVISRREGTGLDDGPLYRVRFGDGDRIVPGRELTDDVGES